MNRYYFSFLITIFILGAASTAKASDPYPYQYNKIKEANRAATSNRTYFGSARSKRNSLPDPEVIILREGDLRQSNPNISKSSPYDDIGKPLPVDKNLYKLDENMGAYGND